MEDLNSGYRQVLETGKIALPKKTEPYKVWAEALAQYAESELLSDEALYWEKTAKRSMSAETFSGNRTANGIYKTQAVEFDPDTTGKLLFEAGKTYGTEVNDLLLASLAVAANRWKGSRVIAIEMEGHGREQIDRVITVDRTVGWFTCLYPIALGSAATLEDTIIETKEALRRIPNHGLGYGVLKFLGRRENLKAKTGITFNYLGALDSELGSFEGISMSEIPPGRNMSEKNSISTGLSLNGGVTNGRLRFVLTYDTGLYEDKDAGAFALAYESAVRDITEVCLSKEGMIKTPSDFGIDIPFTTLQKINKIFR